MHTKQNGVAYNMVIKSLLVACLPVVVPLSLEGVATYDLNCGFYARHRRFNVDARLLN